MARLLSWYASRLLSYALVFVVAFTIVFFFLRLMPGNPVDAYVESLAVMGYRIEGMAEAVAIYKERFGLDKSLPEQYLRTMRQVFLEFDLGISFLSYPNQVGTLILPRLPWTLWLLGTATVIAWVLGILAGTLVGWKQGTRFDTAMYSIAIALAQVPQYLVALLLVLFLAYGVSIFPAGGAYAATVTRGWNLEFVLSMLHHTIMPALSIVIVSALFWLLTTRALTISILGEDYILFAEAKGLRGFRVLTRYLLRNTLLPQVTGFAISLAFIVNGFFLIEWIFRYPVIGTLLVTAVGQRDFNVVQGIIIMSIFTVLAANLLVDLLYPLIDPRIRTAGRKA
jgi:peptide/nickel transport system permease protein